MREVPYRTKLRRTKVTKYFGGDENFVGRKIWSDENFVQIFFLNVTVNDRLSANWRDFINNTKFPMDKMFCRTKVTKISIGDENFVRRSLVRYI